MMQTEKSTYAQSLPKTSLAAGPLVVSNENPRYFTVISGGTGSSEGRQKAIYLAGSHIWNNFHDGMGPGPGKEYLILQPKQPAGTFTVMLEAGDYIVEWFNVDRRETKRAETIRSENTASTNFTAPFSGDNPAVLYLKRV